MWVVGLPEVAAAAKVEAPKALAGRVVEVVVLVAAVVVTKCW